MMEDTGELIHVPTDTSTALAASWRQQGAPDNIVYDHPQSVSRYAIGSNPLPSPNTTTRFSSVGYE